MTNMIRTLTIAAALLGPLNPVHGADRHLCSGELNGGRVEAQLGDCNFAANPSRALFPRYWNVATKIFAQCHYYDLCSVTAIIDRRKTIIRVIEVHKKTENQNECESEECKSHYVDEKSAK